MDAAWRMEGRRGYRLFTRRIERETGEALNLRGDIPEIRLHDHKPVAVDSTVSKVRPPSPARVSVGFVWPPRTVIQGLMRKDGLVNQCSKV